jgi:5-methylcytosine-specific restriction enzyme subunit McrC
MAWLYNIIKNGTLVDNQIYSARAGELCNQRFERNIKLYQKKPGEHYKIWNDESKLWQSLSIISNSLEKVSKENIVLLNDRNYEHNTENNLIKLAGMNARNFTLTTGNLIGFVKSGEYSVKISSRFGDSFLHYIIADADGFLELKDWGGDKASDGFEWLLIYLWKIKLMKAYRLGLPKAYVSKEERLNKVRGRINVNTYFQGSYDGKYQCQYREHSYHNPANLLIAETFNKLKGDPFLNDMHFIHHTFLSAVDGERAKARQLADTPHFTNPFYSDYNTVIDLSKRILQDELADFGEQSDTSAFLFDVSMLFEYFIRKLLTRHGFSLADKYSEQLTVPTGSIGRYERKLEPDIVFDYEGRAYIFDVKYKYFDFVYGVKREDLFQLHTYIGQYSNLQDIGGCGFIYPLSEEKWEENELDKKGNLLHTTLKQGGKEIPFHILFLKIPKNNKVVEEKKETFVQNFQENCRRLLEIISQKVIS